MTSPSDQPRQRELPQREPRGFHWARAALILVAFSVVLPSPLSSRWGAKLSGSLAELVCLCFLWAILTWWNFKNSHTARDKRGGGQWAGASLALDVVALTLLLAMSGAAQNPFTLLYFVPITLATVVAPKWTWRVALLAVVGFSLLLLQTALALSVHRNHAQHAHFFQHVEGMAVALAVAGAFVTFSVNRIARELAAQRATIEELSRARQEDHFVIGLSALSAGAAHELGSPLGTIQLLAEELPHVSPEERDAALGTIVTEVQRMKKIVHAMSSSEISAELSGDGQPWSLRLLAIESEELAVQLEQGGEALTTQPQAILTQILRELVENAQRVASPDGVHVLIDGGEHEISIVVSDDGPGLSEDELLNAQKPFVSERGGMGLGLFLAQVHARQLGGRLLLSSQVGKGTRAELRLPRLFTGTSLSSALVSQGSRGRPS